MLFMPRLQDKHILPLVDCGKYFCIYIYGKIISEFETTLSGEFKCQLLNNRMKWTEEAF